jgi:hypothetical protein
VDGVAGTEARRQDSPRLRLAPVLEDARYIIVIRDPKDVFVSSYFFFVKHGPFSFTRFSADTWLEVFLSSGMGVWSSWPVNTAGYWAAGTSPTC